MIFCMPSAVSLSVFHLIAAADSTIIAVLLAHTYAYRSESNYINAYFIQIHSICV